MLSKPQFNTEQIREQDRHWFHPWENRNAERPAERTIIASSKGIYLVDTEGNRLIDGPAGMWCVNIGHGNDEMADAIAEQVRRMAYYSPWSLGNVPAAKLSAKLASLAPSDLDHVFFTTGGSTAVDSALRFVMYYNNCLGRPEKKHLISRQDAYHGATYLAASCSGKPSDKTLLDFETDFIHHISAPNPLRRPEAMSVEAFRDARVAELEAKFLELGPDKVAAFIAEPIMASGGVVVPPQGYNKMTREVCRKHDVLYIADEVVTGFGRLGHHFASEPVFETTPDIITVAKGITSGYLPLGAMLISDRLIQQLGGKDAESGLFANGFTYSGHPVACAAALKNLEIMERDGIMAHVREVGPYFQSRLGELVDIPIVCDVRGMGLMACVECALGVDDRDPPAPGGEIGPRIDRHCQALGLIVRPLDNMCVMSPPLIITKAQIDELAAILRKGIELAMEELRGEGLWPG
jgi:adenosylmethionine-8-amino-7-oxononanoate aminotransferase